MPGALGEGIVAAATSGLTAYIRLGRPAVGLYIVVRNRYIEQQFSFHSPALLVRWLEVARANPLAPVA